jgi:hypothetical protein
MRKANNISVMTGAEVRCVVTDNDPKSLTKEEITGALNGI